MNPGRRIGAYEVVRELGRGGMGVVHEVRDASGRRLALELITSGAEASALVRFRREAELMARVSHPNVVRVLDILDEQNMRSIGEPEPEPGEYRICAHSEAVRDLTSSPDGSLLLSAARSAASSGRANGELRAWSVTDGSRRWQLDCAGAS